MLDYNTFVASVMTLPVYQVEYLEVRNNLCICKNQKFKGDTSTSSTIQDLILNFVEVNSGILKKLYYVLCYPVENNVLLMSLFLFVSILIMHFLHSNQI